LISRSLGRDVYNHLITLTCHTTLLKILVAPLPIILISLTYGHSNLVIHFFNAMYAIPSEKRNSSGSEIDLEIPSKEY
jgi:ABC-type proline/glycine betaine transport system permease subunit